MECSGQGTGSGRDENQSSVHLHFIWKEIAHSQGSKGDLAFILNDPNICQMCIPMVIFLRCKRDTWLLVHLGHQCIHIEKVRVMTSKKLKYTEAMEPDRLGSNPASPTFYLLFPLASYSTSLSFTFLPYLQTREVIFSP
jgi:hypothetical protein